MYSVFEQLLVRNNVSTYKVAKETGIAQSVFSSWKSGISNPKFDKLQKISDYFGVTVEYLMTGEDKFRSDKTSTELNEAYLYLIKEAKRKNISPEEIKLAIEFIEKIKRGEVNDTCD